MHRIVSETYGEVEVSAEQVYRFEKGIVGVQDIRQYALFGLEEAPFYILHALDNSISFILLPAQVAVSAYEFDIDSESFALLGTNEQEQLTTMLIVNVIEDKLYVNLKAPVLLSQKQRSGIQYVIHDRDYPIRHPLLSDDREG
ncbi:flagellar assembly protein FliW [Cohnella fermenti]|uniref:Flagellar assembly factor FliW n=1 Tax=Cohnella fermenti TaxID=2565925 RepID=A0A4S4BZW0_9BACL|nr:flagellar assembly protein FliW [Cohnella fermenti]